MSKLWKKEGRLKNQLKQGVDKAEESKIIREIFKLRAEIEGLDTPTQFKEDSMTIAFQAVKPTQEQVQQLRAQLGLSMQSDIDI